jgi:hypothetical protein
MGLDKLKLNSDGVALLLNSPNVRADLERRANAIASAAISASGEPGFEVDSQVGENRARASVRTTEFGAMKAEARDRALTRAIDAGRSG